MEVVQLRPPPSSEDLLPESVLLRIFTPLPPATPFRPIAPPVKLAELAEKVESCTSKLLPVAKKMPPPSPVAVLLLIVVRVTVRVAAAPKWMAAPSWLAPVVVLLDSVQSVNVNL